MIINPNQWQPILADLRSNEGNRAPDLLTRIVAQFDLSNAQRYAALEDPLTKRLKTWCATFVWDFTSAMGCEIPHWVPNPNPLLGQPRIELNANARHTWLLTVGVTLGWALAGEVEARAHASMGRPAIASWLNPTGGPGHEAALVPARPGAAPETFIAQAGAHNFSYGLLSAGFGGLKPLFLIHA